jgi:hypothetical protein
VPTGFEIDATVLAVSALGWVLRVVLALAVALLAYVIGAGMIRKFMVEPDEEPDPEQVVPVDQRFRCIVCGAEVLMTSAQDADALDAPRHCREDMLPV